MLSCCTRAAVLRRSAMLRWKHHSKNWTLKGGISETRGSLWAKPVPSRRAWKKKKRTNGKTRPRSPLTNALPGQPAPHAARGQPHSSAQRGPPLPAAPTGHHAARGAPARHGQQQNPAPPSGAPPRRALTCPGSVAAVPLALPGCFRGCCRSGAAAGGSSGGRPLHRLAAASSRHWAPVRAAARLQPGAAMLSRVVGGRELWPWRAHAHRTGLRRAGRHLSRKGEIGLQGPAGRGARGRWGECGAVRTALGTAASVACTAPRSWHGGPGRSGRSSAARRSSPATRPQAPENTALQRHYITHILVLLNFGHVIEHMYTATDMLIKAWGTFFLLYICSSWRSTDFTQLFQSLFPVLSTATKTFAKNYDLAHILCQKQKTESEENNGIKQQAGEQPLEESSAAARHWYSF